MSKILCSTGAIIGKPSVDNFTLLKKLSTELTCDGFEFIIEFHMYEAGYEDVEEQKRLLKELDLCIPVVHCDKMVGEYISIGGEEKTTEAYRLFEINCDFAKDIGAEKLVLHLWGGRASDGQMQNNMDAYPRLKEIADRYGLDAGRIVLAGDSAGAQLAAQLALVITNPDYARDTGVIPAAAPEQLCGILLNCGVYDLDSVARLPGPVGWGLRKALWSYTGAKDWAATAAAGHMSIPEHVDHRFPPTYISGGNGDNLTLTQSVPLADRLEALGVPLVRRFWPENYRPALGHEYQFQLHRPEAMESLHETVAFLEAVTGVSALPRNPLEERAPLPESEAQPDVRLSA